MNNKIFVSIASYKDPELEFTVNTLIKTATNINNVRVVIAQQQEPDKFIKFDHPAVEVLNYNYVDSQGVCWARKQINDQYHGEEYFLQIDSHIAMAEHWDDLIRSQMEWVTTKGSAKAVFATYPTGYTINEGQRHFHDPYVPRTLLRNDNVFYFQAGVGGDNKFNEPIPSPYLNAGCMFGHGSFYHDCSYDSDIYFEGEELLNTLKAFTHGYDLYNPSVHICWHLYKLWDDPRRDLWQLHHNEWDDVQRPVRHWERHKKAKDKLIKIFSDELPDQLGTARSIKDYESYIGRPLLK